MTGGARGIGRAVATALAQAGASVALLDSDAAAVAATSRAVAARTGQRTLAVPADVRVQAQMDRAVATTLAAFGQLDVFVANAGVWRHGLLTEVPEREWDRVFAVNLKGVLFGVQAVAPILKDQRRGKIVTIASAAGLNPSSAWSAYSISKSAVIALTQVAAAELAPFQVQANAICPGAVDTDLTQGITDQTGERFPHAMPPAQVAAAVLAVVCPFKQTRTGEAILVSPDGSVAISNSLPWRSSHQDAAGEAPG